MKMLISALVAGACLTAPAMASIVRVTEANFNAGAGLITFSEFAIGAVNPTYNPGDYGGDADSPVVTFDGFFAGQSLSANPGTDCPGAAATACVVGSPTGPLALDAASPDTFITTDGANPTSPVLSGTPTFNGPISILFDRDQFGVGFDAGFFDAAGGTAITAFARDGSVLGSVVNQGTGIEFLGLVSANGDIAGVALELVGSEPAGFGIDNLRFGEQQDINFGVIPLPAAGWLLLAGLGGLAVVRRRSSQ